jgi:hypothetical protein
MISSFFPKIILFLKMRLLRKIKYIQILEIYIWSESSPRVVSISRNCFPIFDPQFSELLAEVRYGSNSGDNSGEQLLSICASLAKSESTVSSIASFWCFRFVDPTSDSPSIDGFLLGSGKSPLLP